MDCVTGTLALIGFLFLLMMISAGLGTLFGWVATCIRRGVHALRARLAG